MGSGFIFSQMFDVRPRKRSGELDMEKIKQIEAIINLRNSIDEQLGGRTINLRPKARPEEILEEESEEIGSIKPLRPIFKNSQFSEPLEIALPDPLEIISILEMVESGDQFLKNLPDEEEEIAVSVENIEPTQESSSIIEEPVEIGESESPPIEAENSELIQPEELQINYDLPVDLSLDIEKPEPVQEFQSENIFDSPLSVLSEDQAKPENDWFIDESERNYFPETELKFDWKAERSWQAKELRPKIKRLNIPKPLIGFSIAVILIFSLIPLASWFNGVLDVKTNGLGLSLEAYQSLLSAKDSLSQADFTQAEKDFENANRLLASVSSQIDKIGGWLVLVLDKIPGLSYFSSRIHLVKAGEELSEAGQNFTKILAVFSNESGRDGFSINDARKNLEAAFASLYLANNHLQKIKVSSLPQNIQEQSAALKEKLPQVVQAAGSAIGWADNFAEILGAQKTKKYLLVFQNNAEMRATGGFIGTYGVLDIDQAKVKNLFIDGIFNLDGQLIENVVPPQPIQKISTAWSAHDANWFADFPTSAQKIMWFYEKAGGETADGIIAFTPTVIERLLLIAGPIDMPEYGISLNAENFAEITQYKVEVDYDKELNQPKKILADFAPKLIDKVVEKSEAGNLELIKLVLGSLKEKQILAYLTEPSLQDFISQQGWGGEVLSASQDYFSVVNSNINGFKTDKMIEQNIKHTISIEKDGSIIDTLQISRHHTGGSSQYEWYNNVNADYLRVYLPKGAELISAQGQTLEEYKPPIDYEKSGFKKDADVLAQESNLKTDLASGTQIFEESGKTVFGNWVYTSPGETTILTYQYKLPFKLDTSKKEASLSLLAQKQSGMPNSGLEVELDLPSGWRMDSSSSDNIKTDLSMDRSLNFVFKR
ncbi:MAG: DUF4012 domain-containing protein [Candidatus Portnoybacteria bacterium]|nr:DUF4012 domain-containing protein [Candidatus Portnoybacteria bacterium]